MYRLRNISRTGCAAAVVVAMTFALGASSLAISVRHDVPEQDYFDLADQFPAVGRIDDGSFLRCTATLVQPDKVLTAAHCVDGIYGRINNVADVSGDEVFFLLGSDLSRPTHRVRGSDLVVDTWNDAARRDMAILTLSEPITDVEPIPLSADDPVGLLGTMVGFGSHGTGRIFPEGNDGLRRAAQNMIDTMDPIEDTLDTDFDSPNRNHNSLGSATPVQFEGTTGPGDSGGPLIVDFGSGPRVVGVLNGGANPLGFDSEYGDISNWAAVRYFRNTNFLDENNLFGPFSPPGDFDDDGDLDVNDIDILVQAISEGAFDEELDLSGNDLLNSRDIDEWRKLAGAANGFSESILLGDTNIDGRVDSADLNVVGVHWEQRGTSGWSVGDFYGDGDTDSEDLNLIGVHWGESLSLAGPLPSQSVPEPSKTQWLLPIILVILAANRKRAVS